MDPNAPESLPWFKLFVAEHKARHRRADWPKTPEEAGPFFATWRESFARHGIDQHDATAASIALAEDPPDHVGKHLPALLKAARVARAARGLDPRTMEAAEFASRDCPHCQGTGRAPVVLAGPPAGRGPDHASAYCVCPLGERIAEAHRETCPEVHRRTPKLADALAGRGEWRPEPVPELRPESFPPRIAERLVRLFGDKARPRGAR